MKESLIQKMIVNYLTLLENQGRLLFIRNNSFAGFIQRANGTKGYIKNKKSGSADIIVFYEGGMTLHLEIKNSKNKQSDNQKKFQEKIEKLGHKYYVVRSLADVINLTKKLDKE